MLKTRGHLPAALRWEGNPVLTLDLITSITGSKTIWQVGKTPPLPLPAQSPAFPEGVEQHCQVPPLCSPAVVQVRALDYPWDTFNSRALASWGAAMQTCTFSARLTSFHSSTPSPFPPHELHSSHHALLTLQLCLSFVSLLIPHVDFCPLCLPVSQFYNHRSHALLLDPLHMKMQHRVTSTFQQCFTLAAKCSFKIENWGPNHFLQHPPNLKLFF